MNRTISLRMDGGLQPAQGFSLVSHGGAEAPRGLKSAVRLMDYHNDRTTTFDDIKRILRLKKEK